MADQLVGLPRPASTDRKGTGRVGTHVSAALLLGHGHADGNAGLLLHRHVARVVFAGEDLRQPAFGKVRLQTQRRHAGVGHGQGQLLPASALVVEVHQRRTRHLRAGLGIGQGSEGMPCSTAVRISS